MDQAATRKIRPFLRRVREQFPGARFILFGSQARGTAGRDSDYDLLVISEAFAGLSFYERHVRVFDLQKEAVAIDAICLTPAEFEVRATELSTVGVAARRGVEIGI